MQEKETHQPTLNIKMMRSEMCEDGPSINIVTWSGIATREDKATGKQPKENTWVRKDADKDAEFDLQKVKENFLEAKRRFADLGASTSKAQSIRTEKPEEVIGA